MCTEIQTKVYGQTQTLRLTAGEPAKKGSLKSSPGYSEVRPNHKMKLSFFRSLGTWKNLSESPYLILVADICH